MAGELRFRSAIGWSFKLPALLVGVIVVLSQRNGLNPAAIVALGFSIGVMIWLYVTTKYTITGQRLCVQSGPLYRSVDATLIERVRPTKTILSAPALSLDRIEISGGFGAVVISPADKRAFVQALKGVAPQMQIDGGLEE